MTPQQPVKQQSDISSKSLSIAGLSSVTVNNTIYIYGSRTSYINDYFPNKAWSILAKDVSNNIPPTPLSFQQNSNTNDSSLSSLLYSPGVLLDNSDTIIVFNNDKNVSTSLNLTNQTNSSDINDYLSVIQVNLKQNNAWSLKQLSLKENSSAPIFRQEYTISITPEKQQVYLFGGSSSSNNTEQMAQNDFWVYYTKLNMWKKLVSPYGNNTTRCGHTTNVLKDGRIVIIGGYICNNGATSRVGHTLPTTISKNVQPIELVQMDELLIFDSKNSIWIDVPQIKGTVPPPRTYHSAIIMNNNDDIFICGGQNEIVSPFQVYLGSQSDHLQDMTAILDTNSWTWRIPKQSYVSQPYPQSNAILSMINDTKLVFGFGINYHTVYDHFRVFDTVTESWESSPLHISNSIRIDEDGTTSRINNSILWIIMGCIGMTILCSYAVAIWSFGFKRLHLKFLNTLKMLKREIWKPRVGEPGWAETSRLVLKLLFLLLFVYLISTLTSQVINSPIIDQLSYENNPEMAVSVPDINFCFDNWIEKSSPYIRCATDFGAQCSNFIKQLPTQTGPEGANRVCLLFRSPSSFKLGQTSGRLQSNGSFLKFDYYYDGDLLNANINNEQLQVYVYNKQHDPNIVVYQLNDTDTDIYSSLFEWNDIYEENAYHYSDSKGGATKNSYRLDFRVTSTVSYELIKRVSLNSGIWNYAGVASSVKTRYEIETAETPEFFSTVYDPSSGAPQPLGSLHVVPLNYQTKVLREQKAFAFINAMGIFGGLFGLLFSLQSCLFGYRPRSPWGYMHRWSFGHLRSSLMKGLQVNFFSNALATKNIAAQQTAFQQQMNRYTIATKATTASESRDTFSINMNQTAVNINTAAIHPLSITTNNLNTSYLLPPSPTISFPTNGSGKDDMKEIRMALIEDRIHMLERLFQAYYIDDEIFRSLDHALKNDTSSSSSSSSSSTADSVIEGGRKRK